MGKYGQVNGYTFVELLFVLSMLTIIILISPKINFKTLEMMEEEQFLHLLQHDILYLQALRMTVPTDSMVYIRIHQNRYELIQGTNTIRTRHYPDGLSIDYREYNTIYFSQTGTMIQPRRIAIYTKHNDYRLVFSLGKGRAYIVQQ